MKKKGLVVGIILLFIDIVATSSINFTTVKASGDNECVEIITQTYDMAGGSIQTLQVTKRQLQELRQIFDELKIRLSTANNIQETQQIFNDTIAALYRHNLLPRNMNIEQLKRLVNKPNYNPLISPSLQKISTILLSNRGEIDNSLCSIAGNTSNSHFTKLAKRTALRLFNIMDYGSGNVILLKLATAFWIVWNQFSLLSDFVLQQPWYQCGVSIYFGNYHYYPYPDWLHPAQGWISTDGINGKQSITGSFWGQKLIGGWQPQDDWYMNYTWMGCIGFKGIITYVAPDSAYFLGSALHVCVGSDRP